MDGWKMKFPIGKAYFQGYVSFRERKKLWGESSQTMEFESDDFSKSEISEPSISWLIFPKKLLFLWISSVICWRFLV